MTHPTTFDITADLPAQTTTVLEASAGTGKTYAIVGLAARHLAEGVPISSMLLVTFSRAATAELRERMRERVAELVAVLDDPERGRASGDELERLLCQGTPSEVADRRANLVRALSDFDASTIATTHTFCNRMLEVLGFLGEREMVYTIVEDVDELVGEVALDLYLADFAGTDEPPFDFGTAVDIAKAAVRRPDVPLAPTEDDVQGPGGAERATIRVGFASRVRDMIGRRKRDARLRTYDDLQGILHEIVTDEQTGPAACRRIADAFEVVLVDEFQDTDPLQWEILQRCFHGVRTLVLVGDPKQSIYGFRGAEVLSYLAAVGKAGTFRALDVNRRSDGDLVEALWSIHGGATLGHPDIVVHPVGAAAPGTLVGGAVPLSIRAFVRSDFTHLNRYGVPPTEHVRDRVIADVAAEIATTLATGVRITDADGERPVRPGDIAILVRQNKTLEPLREALAERGVAAVIGSGINVFQTVAARYWLWLLQAIEQPARTDRVRLGALTPLVGWTPSELAAATDRELAELAAECADLARIFVQGGFAAMSQRVLDRREVSARVLGLEDGERELTDLIQVAALCNKHVVASGEGLSGLIEWLAERIDGTSGWQRHEDQSRRLDRDTQAVQIMTVHASKGLQFPVVYVPFGWDGTWVSDRGILSYHDTGGTRRLDVGGTDAPGRKDRRDRYAAETAGEDLRLLYVALTRAQSRVVVWWAPAATTPGGPLHRLIFGRAEALRAAQADSTDGAPGTLPPWSVADAVEVPEDTAVVNELRALAGRGTGIDVSPAGRLGAASWDPEVDESATAALAVAAFDRTVDQNWRRTSYSAIIAGVAHGPAHPSGGMVGTGSEPADTVIDDEPRVEDADLADDPSPADEVQVRNGQPSLMNGLPYGAGFGTLVHEVLEYVDTSAPDMRAHLTDLLVDAGATRSSGVDLDVLTDALVGVLTTPLGFGDLWGIGSRDRLAELDFELPLGNGEVGVSVRAIARVMERHLPADDPLRPYADRIGEIPPQRLRGFLVGSIDSVLRIPDGRFVIVDYKTNRLRPGDLVVTDFGRDELAAEMIRSHYPLQAMLYSVALHRYLRWRIPDYDPARDLGPVQYHFVRGMIGPQTPAGCGVFEWSPPVAMIVELSDLLAGEKP